jgi:hypothetical protein
MYVRHPPRDVAVVNQVLLIDMDATVDNRRAYRLRISPCGPLDDWSKPKFDN